MYFIPAALAKATMSCALKPVGIEVARECLLIGNGNRTWVYDPFSDTGTRFPFHVPAGME